MDSGRLRDLADEVLPLFDRIERSSGREQDDAIVEFIERLRAIDISVFFVRQR